MKIIYGIKCNFFKPLYKNLYEILIVTLLKFFSFQMLKYEIFNNMLTFTL